MSPGFHRLERTTHCAGAGTRGCSHVLPPHKQRAFPHHVPPITEVAMAVSQGALLSAEALTLGCCFVL